MRLRKAALTIGAMIALSAGAVTLPGAMSDNMVLQQQTDAKLWGWSKPGETVAVKTSWNGKKYKARANDKGRWDVKVTTPRASYEPYTITFEDKDGQKKVENVLIGEVWFCSGQSNMEMPLNGFWWQPVEGSNRAIAYSGQYKGLRMLTVDKQKAEEPQDTVKGVWKESNPENAQWFSAVGYFFAETLIKLLDVPVGIINCSWGGSHVEGWMPREELEKYSDVNLKDVQNPDVTEWDKPMIMYNGMLHPFLGYTVKGMLWNQGESNVGEADRYAARMARMVEIWREQWDQKGEIPFYMVEIPPYSYGNVEGIDAALLREAQHKAAKIIPQSGIVCTSDLVYPYETDIIHGTQKQPIGERLGFMAMKRTYGQEGVASDSPEIETATADGEKVVLHFSNAPDGLAPLNNLEGFEVAGSDGKYYPAKADVIWESRDVVLTSEDVPQITTVRYCFKNWAIGKVHSIRGLPLVPFQKEVQR